MFLWLLFPLLSLFAPLHAAPDGAAVEWLDPTDHDFGVLRQGRAVQHVFHFRNTTDAPIVLQTVRTTCGCTAARWTEEAVQPGATGEVTIEYDAYKRGAFGKKIRVFFDRQKKAEILWVRGEVE